MNYTLHQLRIFSKIVETKSITQAARELHMSQPAVSIQLKKLRDQFEIPLTELIGRQLYITPFGQEIASAGHRILEEVHAIKDRTLAYKGLLAGKLRISVVSTAKYVTPYFLSEFLKLHPGIDIQITVTNKSQVLRDLEHNEVDFTMMSVLPTRIAYEKIELLSNELHLVGGRSLPFIPTEFKSSMLKKLPFIFREPGSATRQQMEQFLLDRNITRLKRLELTSNEAVKQAVIAGLGYSILPLIGIKNEIMNGDLQIIPLKGLPIVSAWHLVWPPHKKFSPATAAYLQFVADNKETIVRNNFSWYQKYS